MTNRLPPVYEMEHRDADGAATRPVVSEHRSALRSREEIRMPGMPEPACASSPPSTILRSFSGASPP